MRDYLRMSGSIIASGAMGIAMMLAGPSVAWGQGVTITIDRSEVAGMGGFRGFWDMPVMLAPDGAVEYTDSVWKDKSGTAVWWPKQKAALKLDPQAPGAIAFDALRRNVLVRFPDAAEAIAEKINQGHAIEKVELVLPYKDVELWPPGDRDFPTPYGYTHRRNWGVDEMYRASPPRWHAVAHALRKPWKADPQHGPTFNAYINGAGYWAKYGALDEQHDRFPDRFGPAEVSSERNDAIDVTAMVKDGRFGGTIAERLRALSDQGFIISKLETYDHRYFNGVYEWGTATGGRGILINQPKLVVTLGSASATEKVTLPPAVDTDQLAAQLKASGAGGKPTAVLPSLEDIEAFTKATEAKPAWMPEWQYQRVAGLRDAIPRLVGQPLWYTYVNQALLEHRLPETKRNEKGQAVKQAVPLDVAYAGWVDTLISRQPRGWSGFESGPEMTQWYMYGKYLPPTARDAIVAYWTAWLMPDRDTAPAEERNNAQSLSGLLIHPMADQLSGKKRGGTETYVTDTYWSKTNDWRGNKSFFRSGFNHTISTQNFNTTASAGALLAGALIGSEKAMADGRAGFESYPMRMWAWGGGHSQELVDHYYMAVTLTGQKAVADYAPTPFDRQLGSNTLLKSIQEIACVWHPGLNRFISGSSRTSMEYLLVKQDGVNGVMHVLSPEGALMDLGRAFPGGLAALGTELPPNRVALQTMSAPWAPDWQTDFVAGKTLPFQSRSVSGAMQTSYLSKNFGMASHDFSHKRIANMAQWKHVPGRAEKMEDLVTMVVRYGYNNTRFANDAAGWIGHSGTVATVQHKGKLLAIGSPTRNGAGNIQSVQEKTPITSLQTSIALYNHQEPRTWEIYVGEEKVESYPFNVPAGKAITIRDGGVFFAAIPLPASDLGRDAVAVIREGDVQDFNKVQVKPALVIDAFNYRSDTPLAKDVDWGSVDLAYGGFAIELAEADDFAGDFASFRRQMGSATIEMLPQGKEAVTAKWTVQDQTLELTTNLVVGPDKSPNDAIAARSVNGQSASLAAGLDRDTDVDQQGKRGRLEKGGATIVNEPGKLAALLVNTARKVYVGMVPVPDTQLWSFTSPGGIRVTGDGRLGMTRVVIDEANNTVDIRSDLKPEQEKYTTVASAILIFGTRADTTITRDGQALEAPRKETIDGKPAMVIPISPGVPLRSADEMTRLLRAADQAMALPAWPDAGKMMLVSWWIVGPLAPDDRRPEQISSVADFQNAPPGGLAWSVLKPWGSAIYTPQPGRGVDSVFGSKSTGATSETPVTYYIGVGLRSETDQAVRFNINMSPGERGTKRTVFVNGKPLEKGIAQLKAGENVLVIRHEQTKAAEGGDRVQFGIGEPNYGLAVVRGVKYITPQGEADANPTDR